MEVLAMKTEVDPLRQHTEEELVALRESLKRHGQLGFVIKTPDGYTIDGRAVEKLCAELGIKRIRREYVTNLTDDQRRERRISLNRDRRHLTRAEKQALIEAELRHDHERTDKQISRKTGTTNKTVAAARKRLGIPNFKKWRRKPVSIISTGKDVDAIREISEDLPQTCDGKLLDIRTAIKRATRKRKIAARHEVIEAARQLEPDADFPVYHCRFQDLGDRVADESIDLVYTDPPWTPEWLTEVDDLGAFAARVLRPGGILAVVYGVQVNLPLLNAIDRHLPYRRSLTATWTGKAALSWEDQSPILNKKRDIFLFCKGEWKFSRRFADHFHDDSPEDEKKYHDWQQRLGYTRHFVQMLTEPGYRVCDPMCGSATTGVACKQLDRRSFVGCDCDETAYRAALLRLAETPLFGASPPAD